MLTFDRRWCVCVLFWLRKQTRTGAVNTEALYDVYRQLQVDPSLFAVWLARRSGMFFAGTDNNPLYQDLCALSEMSNDDYVACLQAGGVWQS